MRVVVTSKTEDIPDKPIEGKPTLVYWNIQGLAQATRLVLVHAGVDFVDVRIDAGRPGTESYKQSWFQAKKGRLDKVLAFPNLPYYLDEQVSLSQSDTILRYVGRTCKMMGSPGEEHVVDLVLDEVRDQEAGMTRLAYAVGPDALLEWYRSSVPAVLGRFQKILSGRDFLTGEHISIADFKLYVFFYKLKVIQSELGNDSTANILQGSLLSFMTRIEELPRIKEYMTSAQCLRRPLNNPHAKFR